MRLELTSPEYHFRILPQDRKDEQMRSDRYHGALLRAACTIGSHFSCTMKWAITANEPPKSLPVSISALTHMVVENRTFASLSTSRVRAWLGIPQSHSCTSLPPPPRTEWVPPLLLRSHLSH